MTLWRRETSIRDVNGYTALHHAAAANNEIATTIICLLLDKSETGIGKVIYNVV